MNTELLNRWGEQFMNFAWPMLWQSSLLIAVIFAADLALRRKVRAAVRHALWLVVLLKLVLPPALALPTGPSWWIHSPAPPPPAKVSPVSFTVSYGDQIAPDFPLPLAPIVPPKPPALALAAWAMIFAALISSGLLAWLLIRWRHVHDKVRRATDSELVPSLLGEAQRLARSNPGIRLKLTEDSMSPAVCGLFRPVILLPRALVEKLSAEQLRAVLLHEAIHLRRGDVWVNCAQALLQIVYWWHPLLWLANARIRRVREEAVDDAVMLALRDDADIYPPTLLEVAKFAFRRPLASLGLVGILESRSALRQRIERLMDFNAPRKAGLTVVWLLGILAFSAIALPMGQAPEKTNSPTSISQPTSNPPVVTNTVERKIEAGNLVQKGKLLYEKGDYREAETNLNQALKLDPDNQGAFYYLSLVKQADYAREEHSGTNQAAESMVEVPKAWSPKVGVGLPWPNPYFTNNGVHSNAGREAIYRKLNSIQLESVNWSNGITLREAIRFLNEQSRLRDPDKKGINFIFNPNLGTGTNSTMLDPSSINIKLDIKNVSLHDVLDAIILTADTPIKYSIEDWAVAISPKVPTSPQLEMRVFRVDTIAFASGLRGVRNLQTNDIVTMAINFFGKLGVDLTAPGRSIAINDKLGLLFVRALPEELDTVERVIQALNQIPPQIHIKARFVEVPKSEVEAIWNAGKAVDIGEPIAAEIITADKMGPLLRQLESADGVENLAEPEAVTSSGRQTQMRATDIEDVVTNFTSNSTNVVPQIGKLQIGPTIDIIPYVLADGYTINLTAIPQLLEFVGYDTISVPDKTGQNVSLPTVLPHFRARQAVATVNLWDGQTLVLGHLKNRSIVGGREVENRQNADDKELLVFVTVVIVDPAGNRVHSDNNLPFDPTTIPPQPKFPGTN